MMRPKFSGGWMFAWVMLAGFSSGANTWAEEVLTAPATGKVAAKSVQVMSFAPGGVLLLGDGKDSAIWAVATNDLSPAAPPAKIADFGKAVADRLGTALNGVEIVDLAVNPASGRVYVAVTHQRTKSPVLLTVDDQGKLDEFTLEQRRFARIALTTGSKAPVSRVTDVAWADGRVIAAGQSNEAFASKIFVIPAPLSSESQAEAYSAETYHVSHGKWETKAPMSVIVPYSEGSESFVVGAFACTPVVKYPISAIQPGAQVKGLSMIELGSGNRPLDMFLYERDNREYVLSNTFRFHHDRAPVGPSPYWTVRFETSLLADDAAVNEKAVRRGKGSAKDDPRMTVVESFHGVTQMAKLDSERAVVLKQGADGGPVALEVLPLP